MLNESVKPVDLREILPEEMFDEIKDKPKTVLTSIDYSFYVSETLPNFGMFLYLGEDGNYYVEREDREPIGDYGWRNVEYWYKCNDNAQVAEIVGVNHE